MTVADLNLRDISNTENTTNLQKYTSFANLNSQGSTPEHGFTTTMNSLYYPGYSQDDNQSTISAFNTLEKQYIDVFENLLISNTVKNLGDYVNKNQDQELKTISELNKRTTNDLYKTREQFMALKNHIQINNFDILVLKLSIMTAVGICMCFILSRKAVPAFSKKIAIIISGGIFGFFVIVILFLYMNWIRHQNDDWTKYYFKPPKQ